MSRTSRLQQELKQQQPFRSSAHETVLSLLRTADLVRRYFNSVLEPHDLTLVQFNVLRILRGAKEPLPTLAIGERLVEQTPGVTRTLDRLEAKELVERKRCTTDRRQVLCSLSVRGRRLVTGLDKPIDAADLNFVKMLTAKERKTLIHLLETIRAGHSSE